MPTLRAWWLRLRGLFRRDAVAEFDEELHSHIEMHSAEGVLAGLSEQEARRQALVKLGGADQVRQVYRERAGAPWFEALFADLRFALRGFLRNPLFAITAVVTLALGIGAATAVLSVVDRILFRSLPYAQDDRLVSFGLVQSLERQEFMLGSFFYEWRNNQKPFASVTFERGEHECNLTEQNPVQLRCGIVAANFLSTLGVSPALGRNFLPEEDVPHGARVAILSDSLWLARYNRDPGVLGKTLQIDGSATTIVGVLPRHFEMPRLQPVDLLLPAQMDIAAQHTLNSGIGQPMWAFARLRPGVNIAEATTEMMPLFLKTQQWIPAQFRNDFHLEVRSVRDRQMQDAYKPAWVLLGAVFAVLLIACANVTGLFLARSAARDRERAVRAALGASRGRLIRQALTEVCLIGLAGGLAGCLLAEGFLHGFIAIAPTGVPFLNDAGLDLRILALAALATLLCTVLFGTLPALQRDSTAALSARTNPFRRQGRLRQLLVTTQIGISVVLLSGAMLLLRSFRHLEQQNPGMQTRDVLVLNIPLADARYPNGQAYMDFYLRAEQALRRLPGITAVGLSDSLPPDGWHNGRRFPDLIVPGRARTPQAAGGNVVTRKVTPGYFHALRIPILRGQEFHEEQRSTKDHPMIISQQLASRLFPAEDPIGKHIQIADYLPYFVLNGPVYTIVGVAADVRNAGLVNPSEPEYYTLRGNQPEEWGGHTVFELATTLPPSVVGGWARTQIEQIDPTAPVEIQRMTEIVNRLTDRPRFETALLGFFALTGLALAVIGLYGVMAYMAVQRTREIGVRMALGADRAAVLRMMLRDGMRLVLAGGVLGLVAALALARVLKSLLFAVGPHDPASFAAVALLLAIVALAAMLLPARRAAAVNPMEALRTE